MCQLIRRSMCTCTDCPCHRLMTLHLRSGIIQALQTAQDGVRCRVQVGSLGFPSRSLTLSDMDGAQYYKGTLMSTYGDVSWAPRRFVPMVLSNVGGSATMRLSISTGRPSMCMGPSARTMGCTRVSERVGGVRMGLTPFSPIGWRQ